MPERNPLTVRMDAWVNFESRQEGKFADTFGVMTVYLKGKRDFSRVFAQAFGRNTDTECQNPFPRGKRITRTDRSE